MNEQILNSLMVAAPLGCAMAGFLVGRFRTNKVKKNDDLTLAKATMLVDKYAAKETRRMIKRISKDIISYAKEGERHTCQYDILTTDAVAAIEKHFKERGFCVETARRTSFWTIQIRW